jgi:hypothetical protein
MNEKPLANKGWKERAFEDYQICCIRLMVIRVCS